jgi:uncharacterized RmlC-like cupin family protein
MLRVPAHTKIAVHSHRDDRVATVICGTWHVGYGEKFDEANLKALPPGSFYTQPPSQAHFAKTGDEDVVAQITGSAPPRQTALILLKTPDAENQVSVRWKMDKRFS